MRLLYRADGGHPIGTGHVFRAVRLINELSRIRPIDAVLAVSDTPPALSISRSAHAAIHPVRTSFAVDSVKPEFLYSSVEEIVHQQSFDLVVIDMLDTKLSEMEILAQCGAAVVTLDDRGSGRLIANGIINVLVEEPAPEELPSGVRLYEGFEYAVLDPVYADANGSYRSIERDKRDVFVSLGGGDAAGLSLKVARALMLVEGIGSVEFGVGPAFPHQRVLRETIESAPWDAKISMNLPTLLDCYLQCDLAIIAGGLTMYEACCVGVPSLAVCQPIDHQIELSARLSNAGALATVGSGMQATEGRIANEVSRLLADSGLRAGFSVAGPTLVDGRGTERVARILMEMGELDG